MNKFTGTTALTDDIRIMSAVVCTLIGYAFV